VPPLALGRRVWQDAILFPPLPFGVMMRPFAPETFLAGKSLPVALLASVLAVLPAWADTPMNAEQFDAYVTGRTLTFHHLGQPYGIEQYLPDRRVLWAFIGDECAEGVWFQRDDMICFVYEHNPEEQCWHFYRTGTGLRGVFVGADGPGTELYEVKDANAQLGCTAPGLGV
jgi:hypothetical protein